MTVSEKAAYLKGLAEGLELDNTTKEGKLLLALVDAFGDIASEVESLESFTDELAEQVDAIDEDLDALESDFYDDDECDCDCCDEDDEFYEVTCPNCDEEFSVDEETLLDGSIECPHCGEKLEFDLDDECDCDCCCDHEDE